MTKETMHGHLNRNTRAGDRLLGQLRSHSLDRQLAAGAPPGWSRSLAARAHRITSTDRLGRLAANWEHLLQVARGPAAVGRTRVPLCRHRILASEAEIVEMVDALSEARLESAAGVATAALLLRDGTGPLYNRRCQTDLTRALRGVIGLIRHPAPMGAASMGMHDSVPGTFGSPHH
jgi:hypothetical protein